MVTSVTSQQKKNVAAFEQVRILKFAFHREDLHDRLEIAMVLCTFQTARDVGVTYCDGEYDRFLIFQTLSEYNCNRTDVARHSLYFSRMNLRW